MTNKAKEDDEKEKDVKTFYEYDLVAYNAIDGKTPLTDLQWEWAFNRAKWPGQNPQCFTFVVYYSEDPTLLHYKNSVRQQKL